MFSYLLKIWGLARPYRLRLWLGVFFGVLTGFAEPLLLGSIFLVFRLIFPTPHDVADAAKKAESAGIFKGVVLAFSNWVDDLQKSIPMVNGHPAIGWTILIVSIIPMVMLLRGLVTYLNAYLMNWVTIRAISDLRTRAFEHILNLPMSFFSSSSTGELMARIGDINILQNMIGLSMITIIKEPITLIGFMAYLFSMHLWLSFWTLLIFPICVLPFVIYSRKVRKSSSAIQTHMAGLSRTMQEAFTGNRVIKAYNLEPVVMNNFRAEIQKFIGHFMRVVRAQELPSPMIEFLGSLGVAVLLLYFAMQATSTPSDFAKFVAVIFMMYRPLKTLIRLQSQIVQTRAATERIFQLMATTNSVTETEHPKALKAKDADIHFDGINFDYGDKPVLRDIQLTVKTGQVVALVGRTGSGKTTITNLLLRFYDPSKSSIRINGTDIREVALRDLRNQIAIVNQDTFLFNDSIRNNIALGRPGASDEEVIAAAKHAYAHDFILEKPQGYDTLIGERGVTLSGGQRQRIAIARAILKNAPILVLDEATSSLDNEVERAVQAALEELMKGRTTVCIAHRLSTIQRADVIVVLEAGQIVETGTHTELLAHGGVYQKLHAAQFNV